jgi:hypothetical protein
MNIQRFGIALLMAGALQAGVITYDIQVDTSAISGTSGYLDFQFNPGDTPYDAGTAMLSGFMTDGMLTGALSDIGDVSGDLPDLVAIDDSDVDNEYTDGIIYGSYFDVQVTLDVPIVSGMAVGGNRFTVDVEDTGFGSLLGGFPLVQIDLDATTGAPTVTNNSLADQASVAATPEPGSMALLGLGLLGLGKLRGRRRG